MEANRTTKVESGPPFLATSPRSEWPLRDRNVRTRIHAYEPAAGRPELAEGDTRVSHPLRRPAEYLRIWERE